MSSSYSDETVLSKLSALNDTQDSIVAVAQWVMFHRRQAKRSTELWLERLKESSSHRKLVLVYLANEIIQQSKARSKPEFLNAFTPLISEGTEVAYKGCSPEIQKKIRRVVEVWRERSIFAPDTQSQIEQRIDAVDKGKSAGTRGFGGGLKLGSGFLGGGGGASAGGSIPMELVPFMKTQKDISDKTSSVTISLGTARTEYTKQFESEQLPAAPVYAARLSSLLKTIDTADFAVNGLIEARKAHIRNIEHLLKQAKDALVKDEEKAQDLRTKRQMTETTKNEVENMILRDMDSQGNAGDGPKTPEREIKSPEIEALTPPAQIQHEVQSPVPASELHHRHSIAPADPPQPPEFHAGASELLASLSGQFNNHSGLKRPQAETEDTNMFEGIDEDLVNMFKNENAQDQKRTKLDIPDDDEYRP